MTRLSEYDTPTMARIFAEQGYLRKAAEIYRRLAAREPDRDDLRQALAAIEQRIALQPEPSRKELTLLLREWRDLVLDRQGSQPNRSAQKRDTSSHRGGEDERKQGKA